jgi:hypothetical protein
MGARRGCAFVSTVAALRPSQAVQDAFVRELEPCRHGPRRHLSRRFCHRHSHPLPRSKRRGLHWRSGRRCDEGGRWSDGRYSDCC